MKKLNSNFGKNRILDKKSEILTDEDMERRNKDEGQNRRVLERDWKILRRIAYYKNIKIQEVLREVEEQFVKDIESGAYRPPVIPIRLNTVKEVREMKLKSVKMSTSLYEKLKEQKDKTKTPLLYIFSDYMEFYYRNSPHYPAKGVTKKLRLFEEMEMKVESIVEEREENRRRRW